MTDQSGKLSHDAGIETEADFLREYRHQKYAKPSVTVDLVIFTIIDNDLKVLLIKRRGHPFQGHWALPGGFVDVGNAQDEQGEDVEQAAHRELAEETSLPEGSCYLEQLFTFGNAYRDPRTRVITVAYYALVPPHLSLVVKAGDDASEALWFSVEKELPSMEVAFDHPGILKMGVERIRGKIDYAPIAFELVPPTFTVSELKAVYSVVKGEGFRGKNFYRRFRRMQSDGIIEEAPGFRATATRRAKVYRFVKGD